MKIWTITFFWSFTVFFNACRSKNGKILKKEYYSNGVLKSEGYYMNDSILTDTFKLYRLNGKLDYILVFNNQGKLNGTCLYYDTLGSLVQKKDYKNGILDGDVVDFYRTGAIKTKAWVHEGLFQGDISTFYSNGRIKSYNFNDFYQHTLLVLNYDSISNKLIGQEGKDIIADSLIDKKDTAVFRFLLAHPPFTKNEVLVEELDKNHNVIKKYPIKDNYPYVEFSVVKHKDMSSIRVTSSQFDSVKDKRISFVYLYNSK